MLKSICVLVLAMSAFAGSLAADTQQQCSDVVPDVTYSSGEYRGQSSLRSSIVNDAKDAKE